MYYDGPVIRCLYSNFGYWQNMDHLMAVPSIDDPDFLTLYKKWWAQSSGNILTQLSSRTKNYPTARWRMFNVGHGATIKIA